MSNLSLPKMTFATLNGMISNNYAKGRYGTLKIAYETTIERGTGQAVIVRHHGNAIAELLPDSFTLDNGGWHSRTTADRLNRILRDNQTATVPGFDRLWYFVHIKQGEMLLSGRGSDGKSRKLRSFYNSVAHFTREDNYSHFLLEGGNEYL